jgi:CrcB protein
VVFLVAGGAGAVVRYGVDAAIGARTEGVFPWGTFAINTSGSLLLGVLTGLTLSHAFPAVPRLVLGTGFCGAFTTFSTFTFETVRLVEEGAAAEAVANVVATLLAGAAAAAVGFTLGTL